MKSANQLQSSVVRGFDPLTSFDSSSTEVRTRFLVQFIPRNPIESSCDLSSLDLNCTLYSFTGSTECSLLESISSCTLSPVSLPVCTNTNSACSDDASNDDVCDCTDTDDCDDASTDDSSDDDTNDAHDACTHDSDTDTACTSNSNDHDVLCHVLMMNPAAAKQTRNHLGTPMRSSTTLNQQTTLTTPCVYSW